MYKYKRIKSENQDEHRLIMGARGFNVIVHHKDGDGKNNNASNLEIMTRSEHAKLHGLGTIIRPIQIRRHPSFHAYNMGCRCEKCKTFKHERYLQSKSRLTSCPC